MLPIPRTVSVEHLEENVAAAGIQLSTDEVRALEDIAVFVPGEFRELLTGSPHRAEPFGVAEFVHRVADRGGTCGSSRVAVIS
jgi:hypothetical protein